MDSPNLPAIGAGTAFDIKQMGVALTTGSHGLLDQCVRWILTADWFTHYTACKVVLIRKPIHF
jgi:hypothetical protein